MNKVKKGVIAIIIIGAIAAAAYTYKTKYMVETPLTPAVETKVEVPTTPTAEDKK